MSRPVFSFRPNPENPEHRRAWEILKRVPEGQKNRFLVRAILQEDLARHLEECVRQAVREEVGGTAVRTEIRSSGAGSPGGRDPGVGDSRPDAGFFVPDGRVRYSWGHGICRGDCSGPLCVHRNGKRQGKEVVPF